MPKLSQDTIKEINRRLADDPNGTFLRSVRRPFETAVEKVAREEGIEVEEDVIRITAEQQMIEAGIDW